MSKKQKCIIRDCDDVFLAEGIAIVPEDKKIEAALNIKVKISKKLLANKSVTIYLFDELKGESVYRARVQSCIEGNLILKNL